MGTGDHSKWQYQMHLLWGGLAWAQQGLRGASFRAIPDSHLGVD